MSNSLTLTDSVWHQVIEYYFDNIHWEQEDKNGNPTKWVKQKYGAHVDMDKRIILFESEQKRNWFAMRWMS
jgi:hypothetical protein